jgi:hypothetical protein
MPRLLKIGFRMSISPPRVNDFDPLSPLFLFDANEETDLDRRVQEAITGRSSNESPSIFSGSSSSSSSGEVSPSQQVESSERRQKKRKRKEESALEKNIRFVAKLEKDVRDYDQEIESLKIRRQQTIDAHNQASIDLYRQGLLQNKLLPPRRILSSDEVQVLSIQRIVNSCLLAMCNQNAQSIVIPVTNLI